MGNRNNHTRSRLGRRCLARAVFASVGLWACFDAQALDCTLSATGVAFGVYDAASTTPTDSAGNVSVRCTHVGGGAVKTLQPGSSG